MKILTYIIGAAIILWMLSQIIIGITVDHGAIASHKTIEQFISNNK